MHSIEQLLQAADFIERRDREAEHGYASTLPMPDEYNYNSPKRRSKSKKSQSNRSTHNELEKNRRAHLRHCLERLKDLVPLGVDSSRHTTLGLLTKARTFIKNLEEKERKAILLRDQLERENRHLRRRLDLLLQQSNHNHNLFRLRQERSISECSTSTNSSSPTSSINQEESDEIDIVGDFQSDSDDRCSIESLGSDGGSADCRHYRSNFLEDSGVSL
ncbi:max dimerization protein 1 [Biomphalaria glabrata]|uniref:Max dimerization protein 1-like n=1 Tax=Biomphalaria glabrata TaxID=6526 RepID=A0A2C9LZZ3_BIOGL|nr:max dimerization protein 1-like [Biomphalaria glabrata]KAI8768465.1 max dimerization protein 1-like [Biomphalaria glabrata]KAI8777633.1 max dimerization protein 1 [Biomphalaria glabrata]